MIGFYGLGAMGYPMAGLLRRSGQVVAVADILPSRVSAWNAEFGSTSPDAVDPDVVITCVTDETALDAMLGGAGGIVANTRPGRLYIDHTTTSPELARSLAALAAEHGSMFVDAPLSGAASGATAGDLSAFVGGSAAALAMARPILEAYCTRITHLGAAGAGQVGKICNQIAIAGIVRGLAEANMLAAAAGLDRAALFDALSAGSACSRQLDQHRLRLTDGEPFESLFEWLAKDLKLAMGEARAQNVAMPLTTLVDVLLASHSNSLK